MKKRVPVDYFEKGTEKNLFQKIWHGRKFATVLSILRGFEKRPRKILDVGCADGSFLDKLLTSFPKSKGYGVDNYGEAVKYGQRKYAHINFQVADACRLPFNKETFDLVICCETLEHLKDPRKALLEIKRVAKKDGVVVIELDSGSLLFRFVWYFWTRFMKGKVWKRTHLHQFNSKKLRRIFGDNGFLIKREVFFNFDMGVCYLLEKRLEE